MYVYVIGPKSGPFKIGIAANVETRRSIANVGNHQYLFVHHKHKADDEKQAKIIENELHYQYSSRHIRGEWFDITPDEVSNISQQIFNSTMMTMAPAGWSLLRKTAEEFTAEVCKISRQVLNISELELASLSNVKESTIKAFEAGTNTPITRNLEALKNAFEVKGISYVPQGNGQRYKLLI